MAAQAPSVLPRGCPGRKALCARGFLLSTQTGQAFTEGGHNDSCLARKIAGTHFLEETGMEAKPDSQFLNIS